MVFIFIGAMDHINAMPLVVNRMFAFTKTRSSTILATLFATALTNAMTSNQYATSFIVGDAFKSRTTRSRFRARCSRGRSKTPGR